MLPEPRARPTLSWQRSRAAQPIARPVAPVGDRRPRSSPPASTGSGSGTQTAPDESGPIRPAPSAHARIVTRAGTGAETVESAGTRQSRDDGGKSGSVPGAP